MSIKTTITSNSLASATIGDKTLTRRTEGGQVIYDAAGSGGGGGSDGGDQGNFAGYLRAHTLNINSYYRTGSQVFETINSDLNFDFFHYQAGMSEYLLMTSMVNKNSKRVYISVGSANGPIPAFTYLEPLEGMVMGTFMSSSYAYGLWDGTNVFPGYKYNGANAILSSSGNITNWKTSANFAWGQHGSSDFIFKMYTDGAPSYLFPGGLGLDSNVSHSGLNNRDANGIYQLTEA